MNTPMEMDTNLGSAEKRKNLLMSLVLVFVLVKNKVLRGKWMNLLRTQIYVDTSRK